MVLSMLDIQADLGRVRALSDEALLSSLGGLVRVGRWQVAVIIAHLGEVESRRLHLLAGYGSMFAYCLARLGMSEDEACRRIDVARLARRFPLVLDRLASGSVSLSVVALLKAHLVEANQVELLAAMSGKTVAQAREVLARWFPQPDVAASIRRLPAPRVVHVAATSERPSADGSTVAVAAPVLAVAVLDGAKPEPGPSGASPRASINDGVAPEPDSASVQRPRVARNLEPLSPERYKLQLTLGGECKRKLELARDLLRHAVPSGDLAMLFERALDALLEQTMKRRFGATGATPKKVVRSREAVPLEATARSRDAVQPESTVASREAAPLETTARSRDAVPLETTARSREAAPLESTDLLRRAAAPESTAPLHDAASRREASLDAVQLEPKASPASSTLGASPIESISGANEASAPRRSTSSSPPTSRSSRHIPHDVRRAVFDRDGAGCTWVGPDGVRCNGRAWLEHDHQRPWGQGGLSDVSNVRLCCRAHNRLAAERAYGRDVVEGCIARSSRGRGRAGAPGAVGVDAQ